MMGDSGGFRMAPGEHARIKRDLAEATARRVAKAQRPAPVVDVNANHAADMLLALAAIVFLWSITAGLIYMYGRVGL
jgi:hypothetical protein